MKSLLLQAVVLLFGIAAFGFRPPGKKDNSGSVVIKFNNLFGGEALDFEKEFSNVNGEKIHFSTLNYFISNIKLTGKDGLEYAVPQDSSYFLIKQSDSASREIELKNIPAGKYTGITFTIGIDSTRNTMDVSRRMGTLDVGGCAEGMYWRWNSGYIFFKMEGKSPASPDSLKNSFHYHIGGFGGFESKTINNIKVRTLELGNATVSRKKNPVIDINVDLAKFFDNKTPVKIAEHPSVMWGDWSVKISDNYVSIFNLGDVNYQRVKK